MDDLKIGDLIIETTGGGSEPLRCQWRGKSNHRHPAKILVPFFEGVLDQAKSQGVAVEMHFERLDHFNSSTITAVIQLIQDARSRGVKLVLVYDGSLKWQKLSFDALRVFVKGDGLLELRSA